MKHRFIKNDGFKIHYAVEGEGRTLLLIHGWIFNHSFWNVQFRYFSSRGFKVVAPDLRGCGMSSTLRGRKHYTIEKMADDVEKIIEKEGGDFILGHSMGGLIAMELANRGTGKKIVIVSSSHERPFVTNLFPRWLMNDFFTALSPKIEKSRFTDLYRKRSLFELSMWLEARKNIYKDVFVGSFEALLDYNARPERIKKKTLLIGGTFDYLYLPFQVKRTHKRIKGSKFVLLPALHGLPVESFKFNELVEEFLRV